MSETNPFYGATFAERKAIRIGRQAKPAPKPEPDEAAVEPKQVDAEAEKVEDKAVKPKRARKKS